MTQSSTPSMYEDVVRFHQEILGVPPRESLTMHSQEWILERGRFLAEENAEFLDAGLTGDMTGAVDGLLDTIYVALGTLYMMGVPVQHCWDVVQLANMSKVKGVTKRGNAIDAVKPTGWTGPEAGITAILLAEVNKATD